MTEEEREFKGVVGAVILSFINNLDCQGIQLCYTPNSKAGVSDDELANILKNFLEGL